MWKKTISLMRGGLFLSRAQYSICPFILCHGFLFQEKLDWGLRGFKEISSRKAGL